MMDGAGRLFPPFLLTGLLALPITAMAAGQAALRHQITPGSVTTYDVRIETAHRSVAEAGQNRDDATKPATIQAGKVRRAIFGDNKPGEATCVQMLELEEAVDATGDTQPAPRQPEPATAASSPRELPPARVQFSVASVSLEHAPLIVPGDTTWLRAALSTIVHVTEWPGEPVSQGDTWEHRFQAGVIKGKQHYRVDALEAKGNDSRVTVSVTTEVDAPLASTGKHILSAQTTVVWSVSDRELFSLDGRVTYREAIRTGNRETVVRLTFARGKHYLMSESGGARERQAIIQLVEALSAYKNSDHSSASRKLEHFLGSWPASAWRPVAEYYRKRIEAERTARKPLPMEELKGTLVGLLAQWTQGEADEDYDLLGRCRLALGHLTQINRPEITRLLDDEDERFRALACFTLAFGSAPADVALIQNKCGDADVRVRRTALYALAIRGSPLTDAGVLLAGLGDAEATVRQRACEALGICVSAESAQLAAVRAKLVDRLADDSAQVILAAARALKRIGGPEEMDKLKRATESAGPGALQDALREILSLPEEKKPASS